MKLVAKLKLVPTPEQVTALLATMERFNAACDWLAGCAYDDRTANKYLLQRRYYRQLRDDFSLPAQMAVRVIAKVAEAYKRDKSLRPSFRPHGAIVYDQRNSNFPGLDRVSLATLTGRVVVPFLFGAYQCSLVGRLKGQCDLVYDAETQTFFLYATADVPTPEPGEPQGVLGVDLGIVNIATTSDAAVFSGARLNGTRRRYFRIRRRLQQKGTQSAKRLLKHRRRKERRFQADTNHVISKRLVQTAASTHRAIALEDLNGIRQRVRQRKGAPNTAPQVQRRLLHGWGFHQLRSFVTYKAALAGVPVLLVDPAHTSQTCPACGHIARGNRRSQAQFQCVGCGFAGPADHIAACNIASRAAVNPPHVGVNVNPSHLATYKRPALAGGR